MHENQRSGASARNGNVPSSVCSEPKLATDEQSNLEKDESVDGGVLTRWAALPASISKDDSRNTDDDTSAVGHHPSLGTSNGETDDNVSRHGIIEDYGRCAT